MKKLTTLSLLTTSIFLLFANKIYAHGGHPEDQIIDGIDNNILAYGLIFVSLIAVVVIAFIQGKKAAQE